MHDFQTTRWSLISQVRQDSDSGRVRAALGELCQRNWYPVYAFLRRRGIGVEDAQDLTQGFFQHLLTHDLISRAQREKGRFRSFLLGCGNAIASCCGGSSRTRWSRRPRWTMSWPIWWPACADDFLSSFSVTCRRKLNRTRVNPRIDRSP